MKDLINHRIFSYSPIIFIVILFLFRTIFFVNTFGALEHDSGWNLGLAKNLATRGIYASYTNTIYNEPAGAQPNIHNRFSLQDDKGFVYFPAAAAIGPGYIIPEALIIKIFGSGWWQYRAWPLLGFTVLIILLLVIVRRFGGIFGLIMFSLWLWLIPQFTIQMAYEALSEHIALLFLLSGFIFLYITDTQEKLRFSLLAGLLFSFSYLTKSIFLLPVFGAIVYLQYDYFKYEQNKRYLLKKWLIFLVGLIFPIIIFASYRHGLINSQFGALGLAAQKEESRLVFSQSGSGTDSFKVLSQTPDFITKKLAVWKDVGINFPPITWLAFIFCPLIFLKFLPTKEKVLLSALYVSSFISFIWYILFSTDGWARHIWPGLMLGMMLICISAGLIYHRVRIEKRWLFLSIFIPVCLFFLNYSVVNASPVFNQKVISSWATVRKIRGLDGFPSNPVLSLADQRQVIEYFQKNITRNDRIYYLLGYLNAEISPLVDKVFYSIERYINNGQTNPEGGKSYIIFGPYQQGIWADVSENYMTMTTTAVCDKIVMQNPSYLLCSVKSDLLKEKNN